LSHTEKFKDEKVSYLLIVPQLYGGGSGRPKVEALSESRVERGVGKVGRESVETGVGIVDEPEDIRKGLEPRLADSPITESYSGFRFTRPSEGVLDSRISFVEISLLICPVGFSVPISCLDLRNGNSSNAAS